MELEHLDVVARGLGQALTPQERSNLELGLLKRRATEQLASVRFWGRLSGEIADYLIAVALLPGKDFPVKKFYFCTNTSPELQQFPEVPRKKADAAMALTTRLKGDPTLVLADGDAGGEADPPNQEEGSTTAAPLTELERLACLVEAIDHVIAVTPLESFVVSPMRQVVPNPSFQGLDMERAGQLYNYFHLRQPELPERSRVLTSAASGGLVRPGDFWDPLIQDLDGSWVVSRDNSGAFVTLRNYVFPGAMAFHRVGSGDHGYVYFGDGRRNPDLAFMI